MDHNRCSLTSSDATAVYVAYRSPSIDLSWLPPHVPVIVVHNDDSLRPESLGHEPVTHLHTGGNVGFGAGVNLALERVSTGRFIVVNPDVTLGAHHWAALTRVDDDVVATIPLVDLNRNPTIVVSRYPGPLSLLLTARGAGRWMSRGGRVRNVLGHLAGENAPVGKLLGITDWWVSGAVCSYPTASVRQIGGFDQRFFLYFEDVDLCARLADARPRLSVLLTDVKPGVHAVGRSDDRSATYRHSAATYAASQTGLTWRLAAAACRWP